MATQIDKIDLSQPDNDMSKIAEKQETNCFQETILKL